LAARLSQSGAVANPKEKIKDKTIMKGDRKRGNKSESDSDDN
jgi:hypothetical protein